jgi:predicted PurR-regulated permease PerM
MYGVPLRLMIDKMWSTATIDDEHHFILQSNLLYGISEMLLIRIHFARSLVLCVYFVNRFFFVLFDGLLLTIVLSVFLRFTDSDFPLASSNSSYLIFISILLCTLLYSVILIRVNQTLEWGSLCSINYPEKKQISILQSLIWPHDIPHSRWAR